MFQLCPTLWTLWTVAHQAPLSMSFSRQEYWSGLPCTPPGDLPNPGIEPRTRIEADSLPSEPPRKPKNTGVGSLSLLQANFLTQESNWGLLHCRQIPYQLSYQGSPSSTLLQSLCGSITQQGFLSKIGFTSVPLPQRCLFFIGLGVYCFLPMLYPELDHLA